MAFLDEEFNQFIRLDADRVSFIQNYLNGIGLDCPIIQIDGKNHLYPVFPKNQYNALFKIKTIIAHYDRVPNTPGANDNSSSVYSLLRFAERLIARPGIHNIRMIFTDGEELSEGGVASQGAFGLAKLFKKLGITKDDVYVMEINLDKLLAKKTGKMTFKEISKFPTVNKDLAVVVDKSVAAADLQSEIKRAGGKLFLGSKVFDVYEGANLGQNKKSIAVSLSFGVNDRTLTDEEVNEVLAKIIERLEKGLKAELRK